MSSGERFGRAANRSLRAPACPPRRCRPPAGACRPPGTPSTSRNTSRRQCLPGGTAPRCSPRRAVLPAQCGSSLRPNTASASPGECRGQASRAYQRWKRISVSSSLLGGYDEPEILRSSSCQICLTGAEAGHAWYRLHDEYDGPSYAVRRPKLKDWSPGKIPRASAYGDTADERRGRVVQKFGSWSLWTG